MAEGVRGKRAVEWGLVDEVADKSQFEAALARRVASQRARSSKTGKEHAIAWAPLQVNRGASTLRYRYVSLELDQAKRVARLVIEGPGNDEPATLEQIRARGVDQWAIAAFRGLDAALLELRFNFPSVGLVLIETRGDVQHVQAVDARLCELADDPLVREILLHMRRVLRRLDVTARSFFALVQPGSCFAGSLLEVALAADRVYMLDANPTPQLGLSPLNEGLLAAYSGASRLSDRRLPSSAPKLMSTKEAVHHGLVTFAPDEIDWEDEIRLAIEERTSLSPDALTGLEQNLRFGGPETLETKIFGRLSAWQNWIFQRPNAVGAKGALTRYGKPERPEYDFGRT
jgi:benzoyl-CoA-dihydrodiol lyase